MFSNQGKTKRLFELASNKDIKASVSGTIWFKTIVVITLSITFGSSLLINKVIPTTPTIFVIALDFS